MHKILLRKVLWLGIGSLVLGVAALSCSIPDVSISVDFGSDEESNEPEASETVITDNRVNVLVDASNEIGIISPNIYGISKSEGAEPYYEDMGVSVVRWGGNARTRFNWEINASNTAADWEFRNAAKGDDVPGSASLEFHENNARVGAASILSIPMIGWVAKNKRNDSRSIDVPFENVNGYDPTRNRLETSFASYARKGAAFQYPPDLNDGKVFQDEWIHYLTETLGSAQSGGIDFYEMDNEPMLWGATHVDVRPEPISYDEYLQTFLEYSSAVKDVDPTAQILGPAVWGWTNYFYSSLDEGGNNYESAVDRAAHDGEPFLPWFLRSVRDSDASTGRRTLDMLSIHYYPNNGAFSNDTSEEMQAKRLRSTRSLWDNAYDDDSWIARTDDGPIVRLIPRMREWIDANYPGTKLAITEWNWGAKDHISGGLATADVLGIFGREGVDLATYWGDTGEGTPTYWAFRMFRNYDGWGNKFGDVSVEANSSRINFVTSYASKSTQNNRLTIVSINKSPTTAAQVSFDLRGIAPDGKVLVYQYGADNPSEIVQVPSIKMTGSALSHELPPYSITMLVSGLNSDLDLNNPPAIVSAPSGEIVGGQSYTFAVEAIDPDDGDVLSFSLDAAPAGMTIDSTTGVIGWHTDKSQSGEFGVSVRVKDTTGLSETLSYTINVLEQSAALSGGLMGHWKFDDETGQMASDASGKLHHGYLGLNAESGADDPTWTQGIAGSALKFDGIDDLLIIDDHPDFELGEYTWSLWIKGDHAPGNVTVSQPISNADQQFNFSWDHLAGGFASAAAHQSGETWKSARITTLINAGVWYHIAATYDGSLLSVYLNGKLESAVEIDIPNAKDGGIVVGGPKSAKGIVSSHFAGAIDEIRIYDRSLSSAEISYLFDHTDQRVKETN